MCNSYFIFKVYTASKRVKQTLHTVDSSVETNRMEQVDLREDLSNKGVNILCQLEETREEKKVAHDQHEFKPEDLPSLPSTETVTKENIPEIKAEPIKQVKHPDTKKKPEASGVEKEVQKLPYLVLKSDVSQTKPQFVDKVVASNEAVSINAMPKDTGINLRKEHKMSERGTLINTYTCASFEMPKIFTHLHKIFLVLSCSACRVGKRNYLMFNFSCVKSYFCNTSETVMSD